MDIPYGYCRCGCGGKTSIATMTSKREGVRKGEPRHYIVGHHRRSSPLDYVEEDRGYTTPCWIWQRYIMKKEGYGRASIPGTCTMGLAHRVYYERFKGPLVKGQHLDHLCRVRCCVNPDHLEPVTNAENLRRGDNTKLTADQVRAIRASSLKPKELAALTGMSRESIYHIRSRRRWRDI